MENADAAAKVLGDAGFEVSTFAVDVSSRESVLALVAQAVSTPYEVGSVGAMLVGAEAAFIAGGTS